MHTDLTRANYTPLKRSFWSKVKHVFRERQIYVRSDGALRFVVIRPWQIVLTTAVCLFAIASLSVSAVTFLESLQETTFAQSRAHKIQMQYEARVAEMQSAADRLNARLMLDQGAYLGRVEALRGELVKLVDRQKRLEVFFTQGWMPAKALETKSPSGDGPSSNAALDEADADSEQVRYALAPEDEFKTQAEAEAPLK